MLNLRFFLIYIFLYLKYSDFLKKYKKLTNTYIIIQQNHL